MFKCKHCGYKFEYTGNECPVCGTMPVIDSNDMETARAELEAAIRVKNTQKIHICRKLLADGGDTESCREYGKLLERSDSQLRDIDTAMNYYYIAAKDNDAFAAYRYSRLIRRVSESAGNFWLRFSAILGSIDSYPDTAEYFSSLGKENIASYYYAMAAACDDSNSIVTMAKRWYSGIGAEKNESYAKWYLDKMAIPPISAIKLAYKLRSVRAAEPPKTIFPDYNAYIHALCAEAKNSNFPTAEFYLVSFLAHNGDINAEARMGAMLAEGLGCKQDTERAKACLDSSISSGNPSAAVYMGEALMSGKVFKQNPNEAMRYFSVAAKLGYTDAYESLGDIYHDGNHVEKDIPKALEFYELAAHGGSASSKEKCKKIKNVRENYYLDAYKIMNIQSSASHDEAKKAFKFAAIASAMGEPHAMMLLAECFLNGFGTEKDRRAAFTWFENAADAGLPDAVFCLGLCYAKGIGTNFSYKKAVDALKYAQNSSIDGASDELNKLYKRRMNKMVRSLYSAAMSLIYKQKYADAVQLLLSFDSLAYPKALYTLGCLYEFGRGVPRTDRTRANYYYAKACEGNSSFGKFKDPESKYKLKILKMIR